MMYPFSSSDLTCSVAVLKNYMENAPIKVIHPRDCQGPFEPMIVHTGYTIRRLRTYRVTHNGTLWLGDSSLLHALA